jgi:transcriptional regulator with XRE-family HTH domain
VRRDTYLVAVGQNIAKLRKQRDLTQEGLAERADVGAKFLSRVERGIVNPSLGTVRNLARALDTTVARIALDPVDHNTDMAALMHGRTKAQQAHAVAIVRVLFRAP